MYRYPANRSLMDDEISHKTQFKSKLHRTD